jgi:ribosome maturation factor RimP
MDKELGATIDQSSFADRIATLVEPALASLGLALWGVEYFPSGGRAVLRVYIERAAEVPADGRSVPGGPGGTEPGEAGLDECVEASRLIGLSLEVEDIIPAAYVLEVSTPGLERRFFKPVQLAAAQGRQVEILLLEAAGGDAGRKKYAGQITSARLLEQDWLFTLQMPAPEGNSLEFLWSKVKKARQIYLEPPKAKPGSKGRKTSGGLKDENGGHSK